MAVPAPQAFTLWFAGGGIKSGVTLGATDSWAWITPA